MRTSGGSVWMSPITSATAASRRRSPWLRKWPSKPRMRNCPQRVGNFASAIFFTDGSVTVSIIIAAGLDSAEQRTVQGLQINTKDAKNAKKTTQSFGDADLIFATFRVPCVESLL